MGLLRQYGTDNWTCTAFFKQKLSILNEAINGH